MKSHEGKRPRRKSMGKYKSRIAICCKNCGKAFDVELNAFHIRQYCGAACSNRMRAKRASVARNCA